MSRLTGASPTALSLNRKFRPAQNEVDSNRAPRARVRVEPFVATYIIFLDA